MAPVGSAPDIVATLVACLRQGEGKACNEGVSCPDSAHGLHRVRGLPGHAGCVGHGDPGGTGGDEGVCGATIAEREGSAFRTWSNSLDGLVARIHDVGRLAFKRCLGLVKVRGDDVGSMGEAGGEPLGGTVDEDPAARRVDIVDEIAERRRRQPGREAAHAQYEVARAHTAADGIANPLPVQHGHLGASVVDDGDAIASLLEVDARGAHSPRYVHGSELGALAYQQRLVARPVVDTDGNDHTRGPAEGPQHPGHVDALATGGEFDASGSDDRPGYEFDHGDRPIEDGVGIHDERVHVWSSPSILGSSGAAGFAFPARFALR